MLRHFNYFYCLGTILIISGSHLARKHGYLVSIFLETDLKSCSEFGDRNLEFYKSNTLLLDLEQLCYYGNQIWLIG